MFNGGSAIEHNIQSAKQNHFMEHIIIDGASTDGTVEVLDRYSTATLKYISEPDQEPYAAMNKGIKMATGDVIGILNADDFYVDDRVLETVSKVFEDPSVDSCYGDLEYVDREDTQKVIRRWKTGSGAGCRLTLPFLFEGASMKNTAFTGWTWELRQIMS